jgi:hypothetical protein
MTVRSSLPELAGASTISEHPSLSGQLSNKRNKCQGFNFYIKVICGGREESERPRLHTRAKFLIKDAVPQANIFAMV